MTFFDDLTSRPGRAAGAGDGGTGRGRTAAMALATAAVVATVAGVLVLVAMFPALRFTPAQPPVRVSTSAAPAAPVATFTPAAGAPAARVVRTLLASPPAGLPAGARDASSVTGTVSPAVNLSCGRPVGPVVSQQRSWALASGPMGSGITVTASAYSAGAGAAAVDAMRTADSRCRGGASVSAQDGLGVEALTASETVGSRRVSSVLFRRGDVVVSVSGAGVSPPYGLVVDLDRRLDALLSAPGVCADQRSDVAQFARSLVSGPTAYTGYEVAHDVPLPSPSDGSTLPALVTPSAPVSLPPPVVATTPAPPYWPESAPTPLPVPSVPSALAPYPTATTVPTPRPDATGPGCGWAFTGMRAPVFDEAAAQRTTSERVAQAESAMRAAIAAYPGQVEAYRAAWSAYEQAAAAYAETNARIAEVEAAWSIIRAQQADYAAALAQYEQDLAAYQSFFQRQQNAVTAYQQALADCAVQQQLPPPALPTGTQPTGQVPAPAPTSPQAPPSPQSPQVPQAPQTPPPAGGSAPAAGQAPAGAPAPFAAAPLVCPPVPDPIITEQPPVSPVSPMPPPDPRPTPGATP